MAHWVWYPGDFEIHHALLVNCRREERAMHWPGMWRQDDCWKSVRFRRSAVLEKPETIRVQCVGVGNVSVDGVKYPLDADISLEPGAHEVCVEVAMPYGLPCAYVEGDVFRSGEGWMADHMVSKWLPAGFSDMYTLRDQDPGVFEFQRDRISPVTHREVNGGVLWDFGKETFAQLVFDRLAPGAAMPVYYGESESEALDTEFSYLTDSVPEGVSEHIMQARAFRYVFIPNIGRSYSLKANYEYLPLERKGVFRCSNELLNRIWETAAYTFHLNSREFFLDGIKRDRWLWSGDAYQSYLISYYLFFDRDIVKRTLTALRGKDPVEQHLNTIVDYSLFWIIGVGDYYRHMGDIEFIRFLWPRLESLMRFCLNRRDGDGFIVACEKDWVFIDWADFDKEGAVCAEQMLLCRALEAAAHCARLLGFDESEYRSAAEQLRVKIEGKFWCEERRAYIDGFASGRNNVTRHANLLAILLGFADEERKKAIVDSVIGNDLVPEIKTPYFKFYELEALCATGQTDKALGVMLAYWGGMLNLGATTFWEEYDPLKSGAEHLAMYGGKYEKSLCHAWGASPIYLLGRYFLGVRPTSDGYATFECAPDLAGLEWMEGTVPIEGGSVQVSLREGKLKVQASREGGTLVWQGEQIPLFANQEVILQAGN